MARLIQGLRETEGYIMTSRDRVRLALNHKSADMVPISLGTNIVDGFTKSAKNNYERYLGLESSSDVLTHKAMGTVATPAKILDLVQSDFRTVRLKAPWNNPETVYEDGSYLDDFGVLMKPCKYYYDAVTRPLAGDTDYAIAADIMCGGPMEQALWLRGWEDFLSDLYVEPLLAEALLDRITELDIALWDVFLDAVGEYVDVVCQGDDLAMQDRAIISPEIYDKYIKKYHKRIFLGRA